LKFKDIGACPKCLVKDRKIRELLAVIKRHESVRQKELQDYGQLRRNPHETEVAAAAMQVGRVGTKRRQVYDLIKACGCYGATDDEVMVRIAFSHSNATARRGELVKGGYIVDSGQRRKTRTGSDAIVWVTPENRNN
jgi:hypothetical protein